MKKLILLGCSGSIGKQTVDVLRNLRGTEYEYRIKGLSVNRSVDEAEKLIREFNPDFAAVGDDSSAKELKKRINGLKTEVLSGSEGIIQLCGISGYDLCVNGIVGIAGLLPTLRALKTGHSVALANKETLVAAGDIVMKLAKENNVSVIPLDSEHSAIFQCLQGEKKTQVKRLILTASGGPFFGKTIDELKNIKKEQALKHPSWSMGAKITVDSATMMNKGLEIIEAVRLFGVPENMIGVVIHRESIIHSMIEFKDYSVKAQMGMPDMRTPIQYGLTYPDRLDGLSLPLDLAGLSKLTFFSPDDVTFKSLRLAREAVKWGGTAPVILNAANEAYVEKFLRDEISFLDIADNVENILNTSDIKSDPSLEEIIHTDSEIRKAVR